MTENLKELLKMVYSADTEAGHRLRYHIMRAAACPAYAVKIDFVEENYWSDLLNTFSWFYTSEGFEYWNKIHELTRD